MPWTPESDQSLTSGPLSSAALEETSMRMWHEFLTGYFDGGSHVVGTDAETEAEIEMVFPSASLGFQQAKMKQPLDGLGIQIVSLNEGKTRRFHRAGSVWCHNKTVWKFLLRAEVKNPADGRGAESLVRKGADLLYALLLIEPLAWPLHENGMHNVRPQPPVMVGSPQYHMRSMNVSATLIFPASIVQPVVDLDDDDSETVISFDV